VEHGRLPVHWTVGEHGPAREPETVLDPETVGNMSRLRRLVRLRCSGGAGAAGLVFCSAEPAPSALEG